MKVFYDSQIFLVRQYGGVARYFVELASRLARYPDVKVNIVSPVFRSQLLSEHRNNIPTFGVDLSPIPRFPVQLVRGINALVFRGYALISDPDIVHETYYDPSRNAPNSAKIVTTIHDTIPERFPNLFPGHKQHHAERQKVLHRADWVICVSESTRRDLLEMYEVDPARVSVVSLGCSIVPPKEGPISIGTPYFLHVGRRYKYKNFDGLLGAFGETGLYHTHKLVCFSSEALTVDELTRMQRAGVPQDRVIRVGGDDSLLARYYAGAEALVFPSLYEGFGIPLVEAMRCSCPIITSNTSSLSEVGGDAALYCKPGEVTSISHALLKVVESPNIRAHLIAKGLVRVQEFSWEKCAAETYAVYRNLL
jgi:glycosyltransferase involved in cell wall biosynthesis